MNRKKRTAGKRPKRAKESEHLLDGHGLDAREMRAVERAYAAEGARIEGTQRRSGKHVEKALMRDWLRIKAFCF